MGKIRIRKHLIAKHTFYQQNLVTLLVALLAYHTLFLPERAVGGMLCHDLEFVLSHQERFSDIINMPREHPSAGSQCSDEELEVD